MIPSKILRKIISEKYRIKLQALAWDKIFEKEIFQIKVKESKFNKSLKTVFNSGLNIGNCLITSIYVSSIFENVSICTGKVDLLKGTKNSPNGDHVWLENEAYIIDTTLMITMAKNHKYSKYYHKESDIVPNLLPSAELSYHNDYYFLKTIPFEYYNDLYSIT